MSKPKAVNIQRKFYAMATINDNSAEIVMYGDIVAEQPTDWLGNPIEGQYIIESEFLEDLKKIENCTKITIRINSCGGDCGVSLLIHNRLRELAQNGAELTCIVDGVAQSAGTHIMCACDNVKVNPSSIIMIHKCWTFLYGGYNADEMREAAKMCDAYDKSQISIYQRKTGLSETVLSHMMSSTTYMTGAEAVEKGFADVILEDAEPLNIAASADGRCIFVKGQQMHLTPGMFAPDNIPTVNPEAKALDEANKLNSQVNPAKEGGNTMAKTVEELRREYPELTAQLENDIKAQMSAEQKEDAVKAERERLSKIDEVSALFDAELVKEAKYGENACSAQEMAYRAAVKSAANGQKFMASLNEDAINSGASKVSAAPAEPDEEQDDTNLTSEQKMAKARNVMSAILGKKEGK